MNRRDLLSFGGTLLALSTAGCVSGSPFTDRKRSIDLIVDAADRSGDRFVVRGTVTTRASGGDPAWRTFHDVVIVGEDDDGARLCADALGNVSNPDEPSFELRCERPPARIAVEAEESPCDDDTHFDAAVREGGDDISYRVIDQECPQ